MSVPRDRKRIVWIVIKLFACGVAAALVLIGLAPLRRSTNHFLVYAGDSRVHYERGAEAAAAAIARALPQAISTVERAQFRPFAKPVKIFVCATTASFQRYGYRVGNAGGFVLRGRLFISPKPENTAQRLPGLVTHELSHLHFEQRLGMIGFARQIPGWFREGIAVHVADGAGAESVSESEAREAIARNQVFRLDGKGSLTRPQTGSRDGLKAHLFYRQGALFVGFLIRRDSAAFERLVHALQARQPFGPAIEQAYGHALGALWDQFTDGIKASDTTARAG